MIQINIETNIGDTSGSDPLKTELLIREWLEDIADFVFDAFRRWVPIDSARTYGAITKGEVEKTALGHEVTVGIQPIFDAPEGESPLYPLFVHEGTGIFGSRGRRIEPMHGNVMVFESWQPTISKGGLESSQRLAVFTRYVKGQPPQPYLEAVEEETEGYLRIKKRELAQELSASVMTV